MNTVTGEGPVLGASRGTLYAPMLGKQSCLRLARNAFDALGGVLVLAACLSALYYWDPTRALFKRLVAADETLYETVDPQFRDQDSMALVHVRDVGSLAEIRRQVIEVIWGETGLPVQELPDQVVRDVDKRRDAEVKCPSGQFEPLLKKLRCEVGNYAGWDNLAGVDDLRVSIRSDAVGSTYDSSIAYFRPRNANGTLVIYQHGYAGTYHAQHRNLERLVAAGFTVAATNLASYGDNNCPEKNQEPWCLVSSGTFVVPFPLRVHFTPLVRTINFALREGVIRDVAVIGFSGGAWIAAVMAAVDARITRSYPVAGVMPAYLRRSKEWAPLQNYPSLSRAASLLDLFVLGGGGPGRRQIQIFNRYDRCCYNGTRPLLYEKAVEKAVRESGGGGFDVVIDETHARHKISRWAFACILEDLKQPRGSQ